MPQPIPGRAQLFAFFDTGSALINHSPWLVGRNRESVSGAGFGVNWEAARNFVVKATYAHTVGDAVGVPGPVSSSRVWVQLDKFF